MTAFTLALLGATAQAKTLVYCSEGSPENFNPMINTTGTSFDASRPVYNRLVQFKLGTTETEPGLAESWTMSEDGKTITFKLRHGVKWHGNANFKPTRDFNADDVIWSFERQWKDGHPYHKVSGGQYDYFSDMDMPTLMDQIVKVDDYTVKFILKEPQAPIIANLAMDFASIQSAEYAAVLTKLGKPELIDQEPIGTGPFSFVRYEKDATIRYKRFDEYWGPKAKVDALVFEITKEASVRKAKLLAGECQIAPYPSPADLPALQADKSLKVDSNPGLNIAYLALNVQKKPFDDVRVRKAIAMSIDKKNILSAVYQGAGQPAKNLIPPIIWSYNDSITDYPYDPEGAKKLLAEAGLPNGFESDLWTMPVARPYNPNGQRIGELMQADLAKVGIKTHFTTYEWGEYRKRAQAGEGQMVQLGWTGDNGDPDNFFKPLAGCSADGKPAGNNIAKWCDDEFYKVVAAAAQTGDKEKRTAYYKRAQEIMHDQAPFFFIAHSVVYLPMKANVTGYKMDPLGSHEFYSVDLK